MKFVTRGYEKEIGFGCSEARPQHNGCRQTQGNKKILQLWRSRLSRYKVLQTEKRKKRGSKDSQRREEEFFLGRE